LQTVRALKEKGVEIFFEKENIWTLDAKGELLITIMSSLAQEESRSISENTTWGKRKKFADGKYSVPFKVFLGYDRGPDGELVINEEQAKVVRQIYGLFLDGFNPPEIARRLEEQNILTPAGCKHWSNTSVANILRNEKYKGDALLQKQYTDDFLSKKLINNKGEVQQYYVTGGHPAIISPDEFDYVQKIFPERMKNYPRNNDVFAKKLVCPDCGGYLGRKVWHSVDKYRTYRYTCNNRYNGCSFNKSIKPEDIEKAFVSKLNTLIMQRGELIEEFKTIVTTVLDTTALEEKEKTLREEVTRLAKELNYRVEKNASHAQNQYVYRREFVELEGEYAKATKELNEVVTELEDKRAHKFISSEFFSELEKCKEPVKEFNPKLWIRLVDTAVAKAPDDIRIRFKNGIEI
ncbi:MAG: recombinase family protein, partial [Lachnospiraceae bacterium]|nr:recombinase family protein [Lachnospiraceae bacterium]